MPILELHRMPGSGEGRDRFACSGSLWRALRRLGEAHGWTPAGTQPAPAQDPADVARDARRLEELRATAPARWREIAELMDAHVRRTRLPLGRRAPLAGPGFRLHLLYAQLDLYEPRPAGAVRRMVTAADANAWAAALERSLEPGASGGALHQELQALAHGELTVGAVRAFLGFLRGGAFAFGWGTPGLRGPRIDKAASDGVASRVPGPFLGEASWKEERRGL